MSKGGDSLENRVSKNEADIKEIKDVISDMRTDIKVIKKTDEFREAAIEKLNVTTEKLDGTLNLLVAKLEVNDVNTNNNSKFRNAWNVPNIIAVTVGILAILNSVKSFL